MGNVIKFNANDKTPVSADRVYIDIGHHRSRKYRHMSEEQVLLYEDQLSSQRRLNVGLADRLTAAYHRFWINYHSRRINGLEKLR